MDVNAGVAALAGMKDMTWMDAIVNVVRSRVMTGNMTILSLHANVVACKLTTIL
jgi:hypothetical protein